MLVFHTQRLVLLALPKTGTVALETALLPLASAAILDPPQMKHTGAGEYRRRLQGYFERRGKVPHDTVCVVREPVDWLKSWWRYRQRPDLAGSPRSTAKIGFDAFVRAWLQDDPPGFARVGSPARFVADTDGTVIVDRLFRYDRFDSVVAFFEERLGTELALARHNVSPQVDAVLDADLLARMRRERPEEFALWDRVVADNP